MSAAKTMSKALIACVGGYLGSGKTTALQSAAQELISRGFKVGIITNDQGQELIDTKVIRRLGIYTEEITGGCFCCKFDELVERAVQISDREQPDIILAEAVGSCTDLSATVYQPLRKYYGRQFALAPLSILVESDKLLALSGGDKKLPELIAYLCKKQIAEADLIVLNKADLLDEKERESLIGLIKELVGDIPVHIMSALSGWGVSGWMDFLLGRNKAGSRILDIDYDLYARAEASLGWFNAAVDVVSNKYFSPQELAQTIIMQIKRHILEQEAMIAHLKILVTSGNLSDRIALTDNYNYPRWSNETVFPRTRDLSLVINARIHTSPVKLTKLINDSLQESAFLFNATTRMRQLESFSPAAPTPQHRFAKPAY